MYILNKYIIFKSSNHYNFKLKILTFKMDPDILQIKICEESKNWDDMVDKIEAYLIKMARKKTE